MGFKLGLPGGRDPRELLNAPVPEWLRQASQAGRRSVLALARKAKAAFGSAEQVAETGPGALWLTLGDVRWEAVAFGPEASPEGDRFEEDCAFLSEDGVLTPELMVRRALTAIPERLRSQFGRIVLASADPGFEIVDNRAIRFPDGDGDAVREIAAQQFGGTPASFGFVPFGESSEREKERRLYAFLPIERLRSYLYGLDKLAVSLTCLSSFPAVALAQLGADTQEPYAVLFLGGHFAHFMVANPESGAVAVRSIPVGALTLASSIARETGLGFRDVAASLARRDRVSRLAPDQADRDIAAETTLGAILSRPLAQLREEIEETLSYFTYQRLSGAPERIILCGEFNRVLGFETWLAGATGLPVEVETRSWADILLQAEMARINLLDGAPEDLLTVGKTRYRFLNDRFVPEEAEGPSTVSALGPKPGARAAESERLNGLLGKLPWLQRQEARYCAVLVAILVAALYLDVRTSLDPAGQALDGTNSAYQTLLDQNRSLQERRLAQAQAEAAADQPATLDPGSWAERLVAIARRIGPSVWLTRLSIDQASDPSSKGARKQLAIEGRLPTDGDYLGTIGSFVDGLNSDEDFMRGLTRLAFEGAKTTQTETDAHVDFGLTAFYGAKPTPSKR